MKFRKIAGIALSALLVLGASVPAAAEEMPITVYVNGAQVEFDVQPQLINDRTMVPMRFIFEALGASVTYDGTTQTITANLENPARTVKLQIGSVDATLEKGGETYAFKSDVAPILAEGDRTLVPVRFIAEALDNTVCWNGDKKQVNVIDYKDLAAQLQTAAPLYTETFMELALANYVGSYTVSEQVSMTGAEDVSTTAALTGDGTAVSMTEGSRTVIYDGMHLYANIDGFSDAVQQIISPSGSVAYIKAKSDAANKFIDVTGSQVLPVDIQQMLLGTLGPVLEANEGMVDNTTYGLLQSALNAIGGLFADASFTVNESGTEKTYQLNVEPEAMKAAIAGALGVDAAQLGNVDGTLTVERVENDGVLVSQTISANVKLGDDTLTTQQAITRTSADAAAIEIPADDACISFATVFPLLSVVQ